MLNEFKKKQILGKAISDSSRDKKLATIVAPPGMIAGGRNINVNTTTDYSKYNSVGKPSAKPAVKNNKPLAMPAVPKPATSAPLAPTSTTIKSMPNLKMPSKTAPIEKKSLSPITSSKNQAVTAAKKAIVGNKINEIKKPTTPLGMYPRQVEMIERAAKRKQDLLKPMRRGVDSNSNKINRKLV